MFYTEGTFLSQKEKWERNWEPNTRGPMGQWIWPVGRWMYSPLLKSQIDMTIPHTGHNTGKPGYLGETFLLTFCLYIKNNNLLLTFEIN